MRIGYARVSTQDQNAELQTDALRASGCEQIHQEKASGKSRDRPELERCLQTLRTGDTLVVWRLDRLGRSLKDLVEIVQALQDRGIGFGALAEFERNLIRERTIAGLAAARARGRRGGRREKLSRSDIRKAAAMLRDPLVTKTEVAAHFAVSRVTLNAALHRWADATAAQPAV